MPPGAVHHIASKGRGEEDSPKLSDKLIDGVVDIFSIGGDSNVGDDDAQGVKSPQVSSQESGGEKKKWYQFGK